MQLSKSFCKFVCVSLLAVVFISCSNDDNDLLAEKIGSLEKEIGGLKTQIEGEESVHPQIPKPGEPADGPGHENTGHIPSDDIPPQLDPFEPRPLPPPLPSNQNQIAFESSGEIYLMDSDGTNLINLTNHQGYDFQPTWSPDGVLIAFVSDRRTGSVPDADIFVMNADGTNQRRAVGFTIQYAKDPAWLPHGGLAFAAGGTVYLGLNVRPVKVIDATEASWSPKGTMMAFVIYNNNEGNEDIYVQHVHSGQNTRLTDYAADDSQPAWSPDGTQIAYMSYRLVGGKAGGEIYVMDTDGSNKINLTNHPGDDREPSWSPDGRQIAFASKRNETFNWEIYVMNADGSNQRNITNNANADDKSPSWRPR